MNLSRNKARLFPVNTAVLRFLQSTVAYHVSATLQLCHFFIKIIPPFALTLPTIIQYCSYSFKKHEKHFLLKHVIKGWCRCSSHYNNL